METEEKKDLEKEIDDALRFLEGDEALSTSDIEDMMADAEARAVVSDLLDSKQAVRKASSRPLCPDVDSEWKQFAASHTAEPEYPVDSEHIVENKYPRRAVLMGAVIGVAASLLLVFAFSWLNRTEDNPYHDGRLVFEAQDSPQEITLQSGDGDAVTIDEHFSDKTNRVSLVSANEKMVLNYRDSSQTGKLAKPSVIQLLTTPIGKDFKVVLADYRSDRQHGNPCVGNQVQCLWLPGQGYAHNSYRGQRDSHQSQDPSAGKDVAGRGSSGYC